MKFRLCIFSILFFALCFFLVACEDVTVQSIQIDKSNLSENLNVENFELSDIKVIVNYQSGREDIKDLTEDMISEEDLAKLQTEGEHQITVTYKTRVAVFTVKINPVSYKVVFYDYEGSVISEQYVYKGEVAIAPKYEDLEDYDFVGLSSEDYLNVQSNLEIRPIYERNYWIVTFVADDVTVEQVNVKKGEVLTYVPSVPNKDGYYASWDMEEALVVNSDITINAKYDMIEEEDILIESVYEKLESKYEGLLVETNLEFENLIDGVSVEYQSNNEGLSNEGVYNRPYHDTQIELNIVLKCNEKVQTATFSLTLKGYKDLSNGIASAYVYTNYSQISDEFFKTMDVIYCAFILFNGDGTLKANTKVLDNIVKYVMPKARERGIYVIASLGGGGTSPKEAYVSMTGNSEYRAKFITNVINLVNEYGFDGVDIDWETPTDAQKTTFTTFAKDLHTAIKANNENHLVTAAIAGGKWQPPRYDLVNSSKYLDYINVMTYEMCSDGGYYQNALYPHTSYNDSYNKIGRSMSSCSIQETITIYNNYGIPNSKLIFGVTFFGIIQIKNNGTWVKEKSIAYTDLKNNYINNPDYVYVYDQTAQVPYLFSKDGLRFISYDDPKSVAVKCQYILDTGCAGIMYWENGQDLTDDLVGAMNTYLKGNK